MKTIFKVGDRVFDIRFGWGTVEEINEGVYPIYVKFECDDVAYTNDGKYGHNDKHQTLSFTEYTLQGFSQERPKKEPKIGSLCLFSDEKDELKKNIGQCGILTTILPKNDFQYIQGDDQIGYRYCKQIKIEEL